MTPLMMIPLGAFAVRVALSTKFGGDRVCLFYPAPIVRNAGEERELTMARWGMPSSQRALMDATKKRAQKLEAKGKTAEFKELLRLEPDSGTTNIRNVGSAHWKRWLGLENRCLAPFTSFSEYDTIDGKKAPVWFASDESRPLMCFGGLWTNWTSVRKAKEGEVTADIFAFLTTEPNAEVGRVHSPMAQRFAIASRDEAAAYLGHGILGSRLAECTALINAVEGRTIREILGSPDDVKFRSSMTLFGAVSSDPEFAAAIGKFYGGEPDQRTLDLLAH
jgi:uncharacterized protein (DUF1810 family)